MARRPDPTKFATERQIKEIQRLATERGLDEAGLDAFLREAHGVPLGYLNRQQARSVELWLWSETAAEQA